MPLMDNPNAEADRIFDAAMAKAQRPAKKGDVLIAQGNQNHDLGDMLVKLWSTGRCRWLDLAIASRELVRAQDKQRSEAK